MTTVDAVRDTVPAGWTYAGPMRGNGGQWIADLVSGQAPYLVSAEGGTEQEALNRVVQMLHRQTKANP